MHAIWAFEQAPDLRELLSVWRMEHDGYYGRPAGGGRGGMSVLTHLWGSDEPSWVRPKDAQIVLGCRWLRSSGTVLTATRYGAAVEGRRHSIITAPGADAFWRLVARDARLVKYETTRCDLAPWETAHERPEPLIIQHPNPMLSRQAEWRWGEVP